MKQVDILGAGTGRFAAFYYLLSISLTLFGFAGCRPLDVNVHIEPDELILSGVRGMGGNTGVIVLTNTGELEVGIDSIFIEDDESDSFKILEPDSIPQILEPGVETAIAVSFYPDSASTGPLHAHLTITLAGVQDSSRQVQLFGLAADGVYGNDEPSLQQVLETLGFQVDTGTSDLILGTEPEPIGDEIRASLFQKADTGVVRLSPLARYSPDDTVRFGYFTLEENKPVLHEVAALTTGQEQTLLPALITGTTDRFDPGAETFGVYVGATSYSGQPTFSLDSLNTGPTRHAVRVYPAKDRAGNPIEKSYIVAIEPASNGDYQDYVFLLSNVAPSDSIAPGVAPADTMAANL